MNILVDLRALMGGKISGVEIYILNLLENLLKIDQENTYLFFMNSFKKQQLYFDRFQADNGIFVQTRIPNKILNFCLSFLRRPRLDRLVLNSLKKRVLFKETVPSKIDLFFMPNMNVSALSKGVKKVVTIHDLAFEHFPQFFSFKTKLWYKLIRPRREIKQSDMIIAVSQSTADDLRSTYRVPFSKIKVIYEGVDEHLGADIGVEQLNQCKQKYNLPDQYFLCLSTLEPRKNLSRLIEAFLLFKKNNPERLIKLVLAGKEQQHIFSRLHLAYPDNVILTGFIEEKDKAAVMSGATAFLYPSLFEGFGLPLVEAMKIGVPIITSRTSSMPEIVGDAALLIDPYDVNDMAIALEKIVQPELKADLLRKMKSRIKFFSWQTCAEATLRIFEQFH